MKILVAGPQASGKGTQAELLARKFNLPIFSAGNSLRQRAAKGDELGKKLGDIMKAGKLVNDDIIDEIMIEQVREKGAKGYILDGWPRNMYQYEFFIKHEKLTRVFEVSISDKEAFRRITGRRTCAKCQAVYHIEYNPPKKEGVCDKCGGELVVRDDEKEESVKARLGVYHTMTEPMLERYKESGVYQKINGEQPIPEVTEDILKYL